MTNNNLQNTTQKTKIKNKVPTKTEGELRCPRWFSSSCSTRGTRLVNHPTSWKWYYIQIHLNHLRIAKFTIYRLKLT
jgi:hypothetical protein